MVLVPWALKLLVKEQEQQVWQEQSAPSQAR